MNVYDYYGLSRPEIVLNTNLDALSTTAKSLTGVAYDFIADVSHPSCLHVHLETPTKIYYNSSYPLVKHHFYHEHIHITDKDRLFTIWETDRNNYLVEAEYFAERNTFFMAIDNNDIESAIISAHEVIVAMGGLKFRYANISDNAYTLQLTAFNASERCINDTNYLNSVNKYCNVNQLLEFRKQYTQLLETRYKCL